MPRKARSPLYVFVPQPFYALWCEKRGVDMEAYPYLKSDIDPVTGDYESFAISDLRLPPKGSGMACMAIIRYKSLASKSYHDVLVYS